MPPQKRHLIRKIIINDKLETLIKARREQLMELLESLNLQKKIEPQGKLKVVKKAHFVQFYHRKSTADKQGTYINRKNFKLAKQLAQKSYNSATGKILEKQIKALDKLLADYSEKELDRNYSCCIPQVQTLITPLALTQEEFAKAWQEVSYEGLPFEKNATEYYTARGERVRSKSEIMIADALYRAGIPYRYEFPVPIKGSRGFHPDFICLNPHDGCEIIWEHFGLMSNEEYSQNALSKISRYSDNGWIPGKTFIYTLETNDVPLSSRLVDKIIKANFENFA